ncbi:MAG: lipopolysaccharide heptosyltransferase II [Nitrospirae bacterium]|nr:lipopolysaccharide heptosyltransferase II [Nitrospirota bacterium]
MEKTADRILIRGVNWIGDAVITLPAIRAIRRAFPDAQISLLVKPWVAEIFKGSPDVDEIILYNEEHKGVIGKLKLVNVLRQKKFDKAILLQNAFDAALIAWLAGIPERIGYKRDFRGFLLTKAIPLKNDDVREHQVYYYLNLIKEAGIKPVAAEPYIYLSDEERENARALLSPLPLTPYPSPLIGINPGATYGSAKRWPAKHFAELIRKIINELDGRVIIFGSPAEADISNEIVKQLETHNSKLKTSILNMTGKTNLRELAALISECDVFITNDSGPMHMAAALHVPTVALFGSTDSSATGPFGDGHKVITKKLSCSPCLERECPEGHLKCMTEITPTEVFSALQELLPKEKAIFLDKDGTLIEDMHYLNTFDKLRILPNVKGSLKRLKDAGFMLIGITNQSGIARGFIEEKFVKESNAYLQKEFDMDDFYYCPHHPDERCSCRKPEVLLMLKARIDHRINFKSSYVVGDKESDVMLGMRTGAKGILLAPVLYPENTCASFIAKGLDDAVNWILEIESASSPSVIE